MSYSLEGHNEYPSRIIYLDSRDADTYLATNSSGDNMSSYFQYVLQEQILIPDEYELFNIFKWSYYTLLIL
jgi:hypothetical protein